MTKKHSDMIPEQVKHYQEYNRNYQRINKIVIVKGKADGYRKLKQQVYQHYSLVCEKSGCNECNIEELTMKPMADTPEADEVRKVKAGYHRLVYLKDVGYKKEFGMVVRCKKCGQDSRQRKRTKTVKVKPQRSPERKRSKRRKKDKRKQEKWLKARILSLTNKIVIDRNKLDGYEKRLEELRKIA